MGRGLDALEPDEKTGSPGRPRTTCCRWLQLRKVLRSVKLPNGDVYGHRSEVSRALGGHAYLAMDGPVGALRPRRAKSTRLDAVRIVSNAAWLLQIPHTDMEFGAAAYGRLFRRERSVIGSTTRARVWEQARRLRSLSAQAASPVGRKGLLACRPDDRLNKRANKLCRGRASRFTQAASTTRPTQSTPQHTVR
jgi:hypothetical protein